MKILVTGAAGFIGSRFIEMYDNENDKIIGIDNINDYYDVNLKKDRVKKNMLKDNYSFYQLDFTDQNKLMELFNREQFKVVIHLGAQAGVRYSIENPQAYIDSNIIGMINILECCRKYQVKHLIYASSSSVYGGNSKVPFSTNDNVDHPVSLYAATKKSNELMAHTYSNLYNIPTTGLRFFTVYGPMGRPDMAYFEFTKRIFDGKKIKIFNNGDMMRDFTFVDDIVKGIRALIPIIPQENSQWNKSQEVSSSWAPYKIYNIGNNNPVRLMDFINILEKEIGIEAKKEFLPMQPGDVKKTYADIEDLYKKVGFKPEVSLEIGLKKFVAWYKQYYKK